jgi:hypothetical protein
MSVVININHSTGDLTQYTTTVTDGGDLSVAAGAALAGTNYGLSCLIDDNTAIYGRKDITTSTSGIVRMRFYYDPNSMTQADNDVFILCIPFTASGGSALAYIQAVYSSVVGYEINALALKDSGSSKTSDFVITDAPHYIEFNLVRATNNTSSDGTLQLWIDGTSKQTLTGIDNYDLFANFGRIDIGAVGALDTGTRGTFYIDEIIANNDGGTIGPVVTDITGTANITLAGITSSGAGNVLIQGALSSTLSGITLSSSGNVIINGALNTTLAAMTLSGTGNTIITGASSVTFAGMTLAAAGKVDIAAALARTFGDLSLSGTGNVIITGALSKTLDGITSSASGNVIVQGAAAITLGSVTLTGAGNVVDFAPITGTANITLGGITLSATGEVSGAIPVPTVITGGVSPLWQQLFKQQQIVDEEEEILMLAMTL